MEPGSTPPTQAGLRTLRPAPGTIPTSTHPNTHRGHRLSSRTAYGLILLRRRWQWMLLAALGAALIAGVVAWVRTPHTAVAVLDLHPVHTPALNQLDPGLTLGESSLMAAVQQYLRSSDFLSAASRTSVVPASASFISERLEAERLPRQEGVRLRLSGTTRDPLLLTLNACAQVVTVWGNDYLSMESRALLTMIRRRLAGTERELAQAFAALTSHRRTHQVLDMTRELESLGEEQAHLERHRADLEVQLDTVSMQLSNLVHEIRRHHPALLAARQALDEALLRFTREHPTVKELTARLERLEQRLSVQDARVDPEVALHGNSLAQELYGRVLRLRGDRTALAGEHAGVVERLKTLEATWSTMPEAEADHLRLKARHDALRQARDFLLRCESEATLLAAAAPQSMRVVHPPRLEPPGKATRWERAWKSGTLGGLAGAALCLMLVAVTEGRRRHILSVSELAAISRLPVLASLGSMDRWTPEARRLWGFETLTLLKGRLNARPDEALICGLVSAQHGEGRTTWVNLLAEAARERGYRVLTLSSPPSMSPGEPAPAGRHPVRLESPLEIAEALRAPSPGGRIDLMAGDWVWNLQCRHHWQEALQRCRTVPNLVVLVDLPPACEPEAMLLAENLSRVIWLCGHGMAGLEETRKWIDMLQHSRADVVGAVYNRPRATSPRSGLKAAALLTLAVWAGPDLTAQDAPSPEAPVEGSSTNVAAMSVNSPRQLSPWQERLTLGPGDVLDLAIFRRPETLKRDLLVGPDGRLSYLQARDVEVAGLTVDELRGKLETVLTNYYQPPIRVVAIPRAFNSKKYYVLGNVVQRGVYPLNQPLTIMEAIARAEGFARAPEARSSLVLADLSRSFLVRRDEQGRFRRVGVDFEDLFLRGDLTQNLPLAPDDYLYFPPLDLEEVYVLGEVTRGGATLHTEGSTVLRAISFAGGFKEKAYRSKVLVLRGSLDDPETHVVNVNEVLSAEAPDFKLEPGDIVYVYRRPWALAEELVELAISEFLRAAIVTWTGNNVGPLIDNPVIE